MRAVLLTVIVAAAIQSGQAYSAMRDPAASRTALERSVVMLQSLGTGGFLDGKGCPNGVQYGTAVVIANAPDGAWLLATAHHVLQAAAGKPMYARMREGRCVIVSSPALIQDKLDLAFFALPRSLSAGDGSPPIPITFGRIFGERDLGYDRRVYAMGWGSVQWEMNTSGGIGEAVLGGVGTSTQLSFNLPAVQPGYSGGPVVNSCAQLVGLSLAGTSAKTAISATTILDILRKSTIAQRDSIKEDPICVNVDPEPYRIADNGIRVGFSVSIPSGAGLVREYARRLRDEAMRSNPGLATDTGRPYGSAPIEPSGSLFPAGGTNSSPAERQTRSLLSSLEVNVYCYDRANKEALLRGQYAGKAYPSPQLSMRLRPRIDAPANDPQASHLVYADMDRLIVHRPDYAVPVSEVGRRVDYLTDLLGGSCFVILGSSRVLARPESDLLEEAMTLSKVCIRIAVNNAVNVRVFPIETVSSPVGNGDVHMGPIPRTPDALPAGQFWRACDT